MVIVNSTEPFEFGVKRFYVPGASLTDKCPKCGRERHSDLGDQYIMYPSANTPTKVNLYCDDENGVCGHEWTAMVIVRVTIEAVPPPTAAEDAAQAEDIREHMPDIEAQ